MMMICYKTYNNEDYLYRISYMDREATLAAVDRLNADKPKRDGIVDLSNVDYFYLHE